MKKDKKQDVLSCFLRWGFLRVGRVLAAASLEMTAGASSSEIISGTPGARCEIYVRPLRGVLSAHSYANITNWRVEHGGHTGRYQWYRVSMQFIRRPRGWNASLGRTSPLLVPHCEIKQFMKNIPSPICAWWIMWIYPRKKSLSLEFYGKIYWYRKCVAWCFPSWHLERYWSFEM